MLVNCIDISWFYDMFSPGVIVIWFPVVLGLKYSFIPLVRRMWVRCCGLIVGGNVILI